MLCTYQWTYVHDLSVSRVDCVKRLRLNTSSNFSSSPSSLIAPAFFHTKHRNEILTVSLNGRDCKVLRLCEYTIFRIIWLFSHNFRNIAYFAFLLESHGHPKFAQPGAIRTLQKALFSEIRTVFVAACKCIQLIASDRLSFLPLLLACLPAY